MAKQHYGINGGYRGAVGTVIGYEWNGRWCLRSRPRRVHNPRTERQQLNRGLFAAASQLATAMGEVLRVGMLSAARECHHTVYNHFLSVNTKCFSLTDGHLEVDYENLVVSEGYVAPVGFQNDTLLSQSSRTASSPNLGEQQLGEEHEVQWTSAARSADGGVCITVPFKKNPLHLRANNDDQVYLWAWCPERMEGCLSVPAYRRSKHVSIELPSYWEGLEVHLYGFVEDYLGRASDSTYLGTLPVETQHAASLQEEIFADRHNKNNGFALEEVNYYNNVHETDTTIGSYSGTCRSGLEPGTST